MRGGVGFLMGPWASAAFGGGLRGSLIAGALEGSLTDGAMQITINWASGRTWHHNLGWTLLGGAAAGGVGGGMGWVTPQMNPASLRQVRVASHACSFAADTPVATPDGDVPISEVERGDQVLAYHETTGETDTYTVTATWSHEDPIITTVTLDGETIETTPEHPFYVLLREWVPAADLREGDQVRQADDSYGMVEAVTQEQRPQVMYNITVAEAHTYFVGDEQWLVHNACPRVLILGEDNDFTYALGLHRRHPDWFITATRYDGRGQNLQQGLDLQPSFFLQRLDDVDARRLGDPGTVTGAAPSFDVVVFNGPRASHWNATPALINATLTSARDIVRPGGQVRFNSTRRQWPGSDHLNELVQDGFAGYAVHQYTPQRYQDLRSAWYVPEYVPRKTGGEQMTYALRHMYWYIFTRQ